MGGADRLRNTRTQTFPSSDLSLHDHKVATSVLNIFALLKSQEGRGPRVGLSFGKKRIYPKILANLYLPSSDWNWAAAQICGPFSTWKSHGVLLCCYLFFILCLLTTGFIHFDCNTYCGTDLCKIYFFHIIWDSYEYVLCLIHLLTM